MKNKVKIPKGWRRLRIGALLAINDRLWSDNQWMTLIHIGRDHKVKPTEAFIRRTSAQRRTGKGKGK